MRFYYLLCFAVLCGLFSCSAPAPLHFTDIKDPYDAEIVRLASRLKGRVKNHNQVLALERCFRQAQTADVQQIDSLQASDLAGENLPYINAAHRRIKARQAAVTSLLPLRSKKGYEAALPIIEDMVQKERESRRAAANYLYDHAAKLIMAATQNNTKQPARMAFHALEDIRLHFYPHWRSMDSLKSRAKAVGTAYVLLKNDAGRPLFGPDFNYEYRWVLFHSEPKDGYQYDYEAHYREVNISVGGENTATSSQTETKKVQCGEEIEKDSCGREIKRTPIYREETITTYSCTTTRQADGSAWMELVDGIKNDTLFTQSVYGAHSFSESTSNTPTCNCPSAPSYSSMENYVLGSIQGNFMAEIMKKVGD